ncbi:hypothetical protein [Brevibacillus parabrevis]|uniref:hypothetical protein n=1 Tax=Brevibacillus parabrevis TaxID=54914 RepID=UPI0028D37F2B|nr:hypothetical protein [Brevibacillus parabrevis]
MYVQVTGEKKNQRVLVMGEPLSSCQQDEYYLLPGRVVGALKPEDLPVGIAFKLQGALPSGYGFYREDSVVFRRKNDACALWIEVTSTYVISEWDGLFSLDETVLARKAVIEQHQQLEFVLYEKNEQMVRLRYGFMWASDEATDLESALEAICDTVFEVEARGNARLWPGYDNCFDEY